MTGMLLVVTIAGHQAALPAERVHSVVEPGHVVLVPRAPPHVAGLAALRSRPLTLIDCGVAMGFPPGPTSRCAVVIEHDGHLYGLQVDAADDIMAALSVAAELLADPGPGWRGAAAGAVETATGPLLLLDIAALVAGPARRAA
jgi:purine-binding chemotaxis protein CheW